MIHVSYLPDVFQLNMCLMNVCSYWLAWSWAYKLHMERSKPDPNPGLHTILKLLAHSPTMLKCSIQQYRRTKQQRESERGKHQQFQSLGGNISPAAVQPINQPNQESQHEPNGETLRHCFPLRLPNLSIWSPNKRQCSADHPTDFLLIKAHWTDQKQLLLFIPSLPLCNNPPPPFLLPLL